VRPTKNPDFFYELTAKTLDLPFSTVRHAVTHQFRFFRQWTANPVKPSLYLPELGRFNLKQAMVYARMQKLINTIRAEHIPPHVKEEAKEELRMWWKYRHSGKKLKKSKKRPKSKILAQKRVEKIKKTNETTNS
jgi:hypothetical protein